MREAEGEMRSMCCMGGTRRGGKGGGADKEQGDGKRKAGREQKVKRGGQGWGDVCVQPLGSEELGSDGEQWAASPSQGPAGAASQAQQNENLLTTQNC